MNAAPPVLLSATSPPPRLPLTPAGAGAAGPVERGLALAPHLDAPLPGEGQTLALWEILATLGAEDLSLARTVEPHLDAAAILAQAGQPAPGPDEVWGVYAAEGPRTGLEATRLADGSGWTISGRKPWCSLADRCTHALVTARTTGADGSSSRRLYAISLRDEGVRVVDAPWAARGLSAVTSTPIDLDAVPATPVGEPGWYLSRPGFAWGGIGVAAVWHGGIVGVARRLAAQARERELDQVGQMHLGAVDVALHTSAAVLAQAAADVDAGRATGSAGALLAYRVRRAVSRAGEEVLERVGHASGPGPLALEEEHARRVADLTLYLRQEHAERDAAALGRQLLATGVDW